MNPTTTPLLGIVVALPMEAHAVKRGLAGLPPSLQSRFIVTVSGIGRQKARQAAAALAEKTRLSALISVGFAGGLKKETPVGTLIWATEVWSVDATSKQPERIEYSAFQDEKPLTLPPYVIGGPLLCVDQTMSSPAEKKAWGEGVRGGPAFSVVEMEAAGVAQVAVACRCRFAALKAVSDGPCDEIPPALLNLLNAEGKVRATRLIKALFHGPLVWAALWRLAAGARAAQESLEKVFCEGPANGLWT
jgi:nucleoside phosphorylase